MNNNTESLAPESVAQKLQSIGYRSPDIQRPFDEADREDVKTITNSWKAREQHFEQLYRRSLPGRLLDGCYFFFGFVSRVWPRISYAVFFLVVIVVVALALIIGCEVSR